MQAIQRGTFDSMAQGLVRESMPRRGRVSTRYVFGGVYPRGRTVHFEGEQWRIFDADADCEAPGGMTLYLVSPDCARWIRGVLPTDLQ